MFPDFCGSIYTFTSVQGYRIPLPESEELNVPEPHGVDIGQVPEKYLEERYMSDEASLEYARQKAGIDRNKTPDRFEDITEVD